MRVVGRRTSHIALEAQPSAQAMRRGLAVVDAAATLLVMADRSAADIDPAWFTEGDNIRVADEVTVDLLFSPCAQTYEMLEPHARVIDLDGVPYAPCRSKGCC